MFFLDIKERSDIKAQQPSRLIHVQTDAVGGVDAVDAVDAPGENTAESSC